MISEMRGGCHCGSVRYQIKSDVFTHVLCHCQDCRRHAGAPIVGWAVFQKEALTVTEGEVKIYRSSLHGRREFCQNCGTGLFYRNAETLPGVVDVQTGTMDDPNMLPYPKCHIQTAERIVWMAHIHDLPEFERFPTRQK